MITTKSITLKSNATTSSMVKINDVNKILPFSYILQCQRIESGSTYDKIENLLTNISYNFEITNVSLMDKNGDDLTLTDDVEYYIETNSNYDRKKLRVCYLNDDKLEEITSNGYGRYDKFQSDKIGTYVILVEEVKKSINLPLIIFLYVVGVVLIIALITFLIIFIKKRKMNI